MRLIKVYDRVQNSHGQFVKLYTYRIYAINMHDSSKARRTAFCYHYDTKDCSTRDSWDYTEELTVRYITDDFSKYLHLT